MGSEGDAGDGGGGGQVGTVTQTIDLETGHCHAVYNREEWGERERAKRGKRGSKGGRE